MIPAPPVTPETQPFWSAAAEGRLLIKWCRSCDQAHYYPRSICPFCFGDTTEWREASGRGTIYSYSIMRRVPVPYAIAYVTLEEGVTMMTNIVDCGRPAGPDVRAGVTVAHTPEPTGSPEFPTALRLRGLW